MIHRRVEKNVLTTASWISFLVSFSTHIAACLALAFVLIRGSGSSGTSIEITMSDSASAELEAVSELTVDSVTDNDSEQDSVEDVSVAVPLASTDLSVDMTVGVTSQSPPAHSLSSELDLASAAHSEAVAKAMQGSQGDGMSKATFFGAEAYGNRFVFVIDTSGSMRGPRWITLCIELERAIRSLSYDQEFFVIGFDSEPHPMFGLAPPKGKFLKTSNTNLTKLQRWLRMRDLGSNTFPARSLAMALKLKPDAIFLLSDGEIMDSSESDLRMYNRERDPEEGGYKVKVPIHTVLLHSQLGFRALQTIANDNDGTFTPVPFGSSTFDMEEKAMQEEEAELSAPPAAEPF